ELAAAFGLPHREVAEDVLEGLRVAVELEQDPALVDDEPEELRPEVDLLIAGQLVGVGAFVRRELGDAGAAADLAQRLLDLALAGEGAGAAVRLLARRLLHGDRVADLAALGADLVERAVGHDAAARHDDGARARGLDLGEVVRREEDGALLTDPL